MFRSEILNRKLNYPRDDLIFIFVSESPKKEDQMLF